MAKPVIEEELRDTLVTMLDGAFVFAQTPVGSDSAAQRQRRLMVLVVDDVEINREIMRVILERRGHGMAAACNGREAVDACRDDAFDMVFMDIQMPVMDGYQAMRAIRSLEGDSGHRTPIVAMTAYALKGDREKCLEAGADDYLAKPARPAEVIGCLERLLVDPGADLPQSLCLPAALAAPPVPLAKALELPVFDRDDLEKRLGGDEMLAHFIGMFTRLIPGYLASLRDTLREGDAEQVGIKAHTIRGASANISATSMSRIAYDIENLATGGVLDGAPELLAELEEAFGKFEERTISYLGGEG